MATMTAARVILAPRERQVLEGMATGDALAVVARDLTIREGTAAGYLKVAKQKLYGVSETPAAVAIGYAVQAIARPQLLDPEGLFLSREQRVLVPFVARGMTPAQMVTEVGRPVGDVREDCRDLLANLEARNRSHLVTRAWQFQLLTAEQVITWLPGKSPLPVVDRALRLADEALTWDLNSELPKVEHILRTVETITAYGRQAASNLKDVRGTVPRDSHLRGSVEAALDEASRRLYLPPPRVTQSVVAHRAQNTARIVKRLVELIHEVHQQHGWTADQARQDNTTKGIR
ncbi:hypothetical protein AB0J38_01860 [Streptomyces sp. NPDC050095]|uniref:hypothetical protein n=1 Tax=unclassified Streptomyces TaxID=2593676 RepID=UPI00342CEBAC